MGSEKILHCLQSTKKKVLVQTHIHSRTNGWHIPAFALPRSLMETIV